MSLIDEFDRANVSYVYFSGGEPLLNRHLLDYFKSLSDRRISYGLVTNLSLMTEEFLSEVVRIGGCREINTSLDGPDSDAHDNFRRASGSFQKVCHWLSRIQDHGIQVTVNTAIHAGWLNKVHEWGAVIENLGIRRWRTEYPANVGAYATLEDAQKLNPEQLLKAYKSIETMVTEHQLWGQLDSLTIGRHKYWGSLADASYGPSDPICKPHIDVMWIEADGSVPYCSLFSDQFPVFGNLTREPLDSIWNQICRWRLDRRLSSLGCNRCVLLTKCGGGCPGTWRDPLNLQGCDEENREILGELPSLKVCGRR
jgi:radical SAM protein with 4Fe4S-binding SPASM domain